MMQMTFDEYDELMDKFDRMTERIFWPNEAHMEKFENNPDKWLMFCIFLHEKNPAPSNESERQSKKMMSKFINRHLELVDGIESAD